MAMANAMQAAVGVAITRPGTTELWDSVGGCDDEALMAAMGYDETETEMEGDETFNEDSMMPEMKVVKTEQAQQNHAV
jgi:hypothetical protein